MEALPIGRLVVYDLLTLAKRRRSQFGVKGEDMKTILEQYGLTLDVLEEAYVAFQSGEITTVKASVSR